MVKLGALANGAQSFAERIISAANLILIKDRSSTTQPASRLQTMIVTIRTNRTLFMEHVRKTKYKDDINMIPGLSEIGKDNDDNLWNYKLI